MKQLQQYYSDGRLSIEDVPLSRVGSVESLIENRCSLISAGTEKMVVDIAKKSLLGKARSRPDLVKQVFSKVSQEGLSTTLQKVRTKLEIPIPLGYSSSGIVRRTGPEANFELGARVACGGSGVANHAEYNVVPRNLMISIPDSVSFESASFVTVGAIALQGVRQAAPTLGERVAVIGLGLIGQLTVQILKANGCDVIGVDVDEWKNSLALSVGADFATVPEDFVAAADYFTMKRGVDAVIITASTKSEQPIYDAGLVSRRKGRIVSVGLTNLNVPRDLYYYKELDLRLSHSYGPGRHDPQYEDKGIDYPFEYVRWTEKRNFDAFLRLVKNGKVTPSDLITHRYQFEDALSAYDLITSGTQRYLGVILIYPDKKDSESLSDSIVLNSDSKKKNSICIGVVGAGGFAKSVLLPRLKRRNDIKRVAIASRTGLSAKHSAVKYGFNTASTDYDYILSNRDIDSLFILTRHNNHARLTSEAIKHKKHVFLEKPLAINDKELSSLIAEFTGSTIVQVGFNRRFSSHAEKTREAIAGRQAVLSYRVSAGEIPEDSWIHDPAVGGGRIIGEVCHFIDFASFIFDAKPVRVFSARVSQKNTHDDVAISITYDNGSLATIVYLSKGNSRIPKEFIEVFSDNVAVSIDNFRRTTMYKGSKKVTHKTRSQDKGFDQEIDAFFRSVVSGTPAITFESLVATTRATFAACESLSTGSLVSL